ncbi:hypothetical protein V6N00_12760 [Tersicoccus sp. MR15.9]|uniref:hypothetical protein n=1 Tax=Tersicoccus mangrovi TaxID=3121635 RepID=UPI002FE61F6A
MTGERSEDEWVQVLIEAIKTGVPVDPGGENPGILDVDMTVAATIAPDDDEVEQWGQLRTIPAPAVRRALLAGDVTADPHGLQVHGCKITGTLDLVGAHVDCRVILSRCLLENDLRAQGLQISVLGLIGCRTAGIDLDEARVDGGAFWTALHAAGEVRAVGAHIGGQLNLVGAVLASPEGRALSLDDVQVGGNAYWSGLHAAGGVRAIGAHIGGQLILTGAVLSNPDAIALALDRVRVDGSAAWGGLRASGEVRATGAHIGGQLNLWGAVLSGSEVALSLDGARVDGGAFWTALHAAGEVYAVGAHIGGQLDLEGAILTNPEGRALTLDGVQVEGAVFCTGMRATGEVRALGAHITAQLNLRGAFIWSGPGQDALNVDVIKVDGEAYWEGLQTIGRVRATGAHFSRQLDLEVAVLFNADGDALRLDGVQVDGGVFWDGLHATGEVRAVGAHIGGGLALQKAVLSNPRGNALSLDRVRVDGGSYWRGMTSVGKVRAPGAHIVGQLQLEAVVCRSFPSDEDEAVNLRNSVIGSVFIGRTEAGLDLHLAQFEVLVLQDNAPNPGLDATGWSVTSLRFNAMPHGQGRRDLILTQWLDTQEGFVPQPWHEAADALARDGYMEESTRLRIAAAKRSTKQLRPVGRPTWSVRAVYQCGAGWVRWLLRTLYGLAVGFGYRPLRAGLWLAAFGVATFVIVAIWSSQLEPARQARPLTTSAAVLAVAQHGPLTGATGCQAAREGWDYPCLNKWLYAAETALPVVGTVQSSAWVWSPGAWLAAAVVTALKALSWLFTVLLLGGVTNLLRKT